MAASNQFNRTAVDPARDVYGKPGYQYPTPNWDDVLIIQRVTDLTAQNWKLRKGSILKGEATPNGGKFRLVSQTRTAGDTAGSIVATRIWANTPESPDAYNAVVTFTAQSIANRIFQRSYLFLRDGDTDNGIAPYAPLAELAPDSVDPLALCTQETSQAAEAPYASIFLRVSRVFENFGTKDQQDAWNRVDSLPYALATYPRVTRRYRFPANNDPIAGGALVVGTSTDSAVSTATLTSIARTDESKRVRVYQCVFDSIPPVNVQAGVGITPGGIVALGVSVAYPESPDFPVLTWSFREFKKDYVQPTTVNAACPIPGYTNLVQTDERAAPDEESPLVLIVTREYQILPGYLVTSTDASRLPRTLTAIPPYYLNGDLLTTTVQKLPAFVMGTPTVADPLSLTLLSSRIEPHGKWYVTKTNVSRANVALPIKYLPRQVDKADGAPGYEYRQLVEITASGNVATDQANLKTAIDAAVTLMNGLAGVIIDYQTNVISPTQEELVYTLVTAFPILVGQKFDPRIGKAIQYTEQKMTPATAAAYVAANPTLAIDVIPVDGGLSTVRTTNLPAALSSVHLTYPRTGSVDFPDVLLDVRVVLNSSQGQGASAENGTGLAASDGGSISLNASNSSEGSSTVLFDIIPVFAPRPQASNRDLVDHLFYDVVNASKTDILVTLKNLLGGTTMVSAWPIFKPQSHIISITGQKVATRANAQARISASGTSYATSKGGGYSQDNSNENRAITIRECIHGPITLSQTTYSQTASSTATVTLAITNLDTVTGDPTEAGAATDTITLTATGNIGTAALASTPGISAIPTSGLYAINIDVDASEYNGYNRVRVTTFDASSLATVPSTPAGVTVTNSEAGPHTLRVSWVDDAYGATGYKILRSTSSGGTYTLIYTATATDREYINTGLSGSTTYWYKVVATNTAGDAPATVPASGTTLP